MAGIVCRREQARKSTRRRRWAGWLAPCHGSGLRAHRQAVVRLRVNVRTATQHRRIHLLRLCRPFYERHGKEERKKCFWVKRGVINFNKTICNNVEANGRAKRANIKVQAKETSKKREMMIECEMCNGLNLMRLKLKARKEIKWRTGS